MNAQVTVLAKYEDIIRHWVVDVKLWEICFHIDFYYVLSSW